MTNAPNHYQVLGLPESIQNEATIPPQSLRGAYKRALLQNHPDKSRPSQTSSLISSGTTFSIDQISEAFSILSNAKFRAEYDKQLKEQHNGVEARSKGGQAFRTGVETVDLDDLGIDEAQGEWYSSCRCGEDRGFLIREADLEEAADDGELNVGCKGCSLWLKVVFAVIDRDMTAADVTKDQGDVEKA